MPFTTDDLATINQAIANEALEVKFQDRSETYRSMDELIRAKAIIQNALYPNGSVGGMRRQVRMISDRGL